MFGVLKWSGKSFLMTCLHSYSILVAKSMKPTPTLQNLYWSSYIYVLLNVKATLQGDCHGDEELVSVQTMVSSLIKDMEDINARWTLIEAGIKRVYAPRISDGSRGRPKVIFEPEKIQFLRELNFTWTKTADIFGVSRRTLYNIRSEFGMVDEQEVCSYFRP